MGGVWYWTFFSHGFQPAFTFKTIFKALDCDLHFVQCYTCIRGNTPTFCEHVIVVQPPLYATTGDMVKCFIHIVKVSLQKQIIPSSWPIYIP